MSKKQKHSNFFILGYILPLNFRQRTRAKLYEWKHPGEVLSEVLLKTNKSCVELRSTRGEADHYTCHPLPEAAK